ncbi:MAG: PmbA/TldA family metallopeptidase, partial [Actinomycetota bacterium]
MTGGYEPMIGEARALETLERALGVKGADEVQSLLYAHRGGLTRFAESTIHQHTERADAGVEVRVIDAKRSGTVSTNRLDESIPAAGSQALEIARLSPPDELFPG